MDNEKKHRSLPFETMSQLDPLFQAISLYRRRQFERCIEMTTELLEKNPKDQVAWLLKMRALTEQIYVDETELNEDALADMLDDNAFHQAPLPGTSMRQPTANASHGIKDFSPTIRPLTTSGRPITGMVRLNTQATKDGKSIEKALRVTRTATARPVTSATSRVVRLGTASMISSSDGPFIDAARLNLERYAQKESICRPLFEYLFYCANDVRAALQLAMNANELREGRDWWWLVQMGKCYFRLDMYRDSEKQYLLALEIQPLVDIYLHLSKVYLRLDQPLLSVAKLQEGIQLFPNEPSLLQAIARVYENLNDIAESMEFYKKVLKLDNTNIEAIACIAANYFYQDQPEISLKFYRRLLQMGVNTSAIFTNIALCCFFAQQFDMVISCFFKALSCTTNDIEQSDIWYNIGEFALYTSETQLAVQSFRLALVFNSDHAEAYNNLAVLESKRDNNDIAEAYFQTAQSIGLNMFEAYYNFARTMYQQDAYQESYKAILRSLEFNPNHADSIQIRDELRSMFAEL